MREFKFRIRDEKNKKWLLDYECSNLGGFSFFDKRVVFGELAKIINQFVFNNNGNKFEDLKVMQYIGLNDKNGKEIYELDIIKYKGENWIVYFAGGVASFRLSLISDEDYCDISEGEDYEIIGNIYDNLELLEETK